MVSPAKTNKSKLCRVDAKTKLAIVDEVEQLTDLAYKYYSEGRYKKAIEICKLAYKKNSGNPSVVWDYACLISDIYRDEEAIRLFRRLMRLNLKKLASSGRQHSIKWAKSFQNDCRYKIGMCYVDLNKSKLAQKWLNAYLKNWSKSKPSLFSKRTAESRLETLKNISKIEQFIESNNNKWEEVQVLIRKELRKEPNNYWLLAQLSSTYYEQRKYKTAYRIILKAIEVAPNEPLVMWHYAGTLDMLGQRENAIRIFKNIIRKGVKRIAFVDTSEGIRWARSLTNDCRYCVGLCYKELGRSNLSIKWLKKHLKNRQHGIQSIYTLAEVKKQLRNCEGQRGCGITRDSHLFIS